MSFKNSSFEDSYLLNPSSGVAPEKELPGLIVAEDEDREGDSGQPPVEFEWVHPQALVHARGVGEDAGKHSLEDQPEVHEVILHALLEHRELPGLADDEIGPLDNNDGDKEGGVAGVLQDLPVCIGPLLPVRVFQVVHSLRVPLPPQTEQGAKKSNLIFLLKKIRKLDLLKDKFTSARSHFRTLSQSRQRILRRRFDTLVI